MVPLNSQIPALEGTQDLRANGCVIVDEWPIENWDTFELLRIII